MLSFLPRGIGTDILVKKALNVGIIPPPKNIPHLSIHLWLV